MATRDSSESTTTTLLNDNQDPIANYKFQEIRNTLDEIIDSSSDTDPARHDKTNDQTFPEPSTAVLKTFYQKHWIKFGQRQIGVLSPHHMTGVWRQALHKNFSVL